jgi:pimeloyl-ACP methyl ester carboxylesterase
MKLTKGKIFLGLALILISSFVCIREITETTPAIKDSSGRKIPESIASLEKVRLGGMDQWIQIRGNDISNPVLFWLHGGPGSAQMPISRYFNGELEKEYVVVNWDQRGAGKSNPPNFDESTMTFERFFSDAHDLTQYLKKRLNKVKIYLAGHSWGSQLGITLAKIYPEDYYAYVGVSQVVDNRESNEIAYTWLQGQIKHSGNKKDFENLEELGPPPYTNHETFVKFIKMVDSYGGGMDAGMGKLAWIALNSHEYRLSDYIAWVKGSNRGSGPMWDSSQSFNLFNEVPGLAVPIYLFSGRNDYNTPYELVDKYFKALDAPKGKELILFEESSHTPFMGEPEKFNKEMVQVKEETYKLK